MNSQFYQEFFAKNFKRLLAFAMSKVNIREDAEDILQEALIVGFNSNINDESELLKYIFGIIKNKAVDAFRKAANFGKLKTKILPPISDNSIVSSFDDKDLLEYILKMGKFNALEKAVFEFTLKDCDIKEIAEELNKSEKDIYKIKATMIRKCRKLLKR